jgi:hypothetical protein
MYSAVLQGFVWCRQPQKGRTRCVRGYACVRVCARLRRRADVHRVSASAAVRVTLWPWQGGSSIASAVSEALNRAIALEHDFDSMIAPRYGAKPRVCPCSARRTRCGSCVLVVVVVVVVVVLLSLSRAVGDVM